MVDPHANVLSITIEDELKKSYLDYAMSVIVGRALPDVRDGLKPVHRRVLFAMRELGNDWNKPYKKSARIVGDVIGKYHPHGDTAVYDAIVRLAQPFSMRYPLVDGQGNFGSIDGDSAAAMRYTEIRMQRLAHEMLMDLDKETVDFVPNYDESEMMPAVLPAQFPNLLVNGSSGIAVGMATNMPPHNLKEVISGLLALIDQPEMTVADLMTHIPGPDFPTAAIITGRSGIAKAYRTGRGRVVMQAKTDFEINDKTSKAAIIIHELPYQVNKARLIEKIGELVREKKIEGITALRDESDKQGIRVVIELRRGEQPEVVLNHLYAQTQMRLVFGINMVALDQNVPHLFNLKELLQAFLAHRQEVVTRRTIFELKKARARAHVLEGLSVALVHIDEVIQLIKSSKNPEAARTALLGRQWAAGTVTSLWLRTEDAVIARPEDLEDIYGMQGEVYGLSPAQAQAILDLRLHRLTSLEVDKIHEEYQGLLKAIEGHLIILGSQEALNDLVKTELIDLQKRYGDERRTVIVDEELELSDEDLVVEEQRVVTLSHQGYIKSQSLDVYRTQRRGGRGKMATSVKEQDFVKQVVVASSHDHILCFSDAGKVYWLKVYQVPGGGRSARGRPINNLLPLEKEEVITAVLSVDDFSEDTYVFMATSHGYVKKVPLSEFAKPRRNGKIATELVEGDHLVGVAMTDGEQDIALISTAGKCIRFHESDVRVMGRSARGVTGMRLKESHSVIALLVVDDSAALLTATENGYGQRTAWDSYRPIGRGGQGVGVIIVGDRNGSVVSAVQVRDEDDVLLMTDRGTMVRTRVSEISLIGRNTKGVRLIQLSSDSERLMGIEAISIEDLGEEVAEAVSETPELEEAEDSEGSGSEETDGHNDIEEE